MATGASREGKWLRLARSAAVGAVATAVDLVVLHVLVRGLGLSAEMANVPALVAGVGVQFAGNKWFAFRDRSRALVRQGVAFALVEVGAFALNAVGFHVLVTVASVPYAAARLAASALVYFGFSFPLWGTVFRAAEEGAS